MSTMTVITQGNADKPKLDFYEKMMRRLIEGEAAQAVFVECCNEDLVFTNPEFHVISPDKSLYGLFALETMSRYYRTDGEGWRNITMKTIWSEETETKLYRERNFIASELRYGWRRLGPRGQGDKELSALVGSPARECQEGSLPHS
ncbi:MAG: hypothetical protein IE935_03900 [Micrococcales bacterium]|nr:hypothetical protein [Micrococcales bacterium]